MPLGENVDDGRRKKIYFGYSLSLSSARGGSVFFYVREREYPKYIFLFLPPSAFSPIAYFLHVYML